MATQRLPVLTTKLAPLQENGKRPVLLNFRSSRYFIVFVVFLMSFTDIFLYGLIVPVMPRALNTRVGIPHDQIQAWTTILLTTYGLALLITAPFFGWFADRIKSRQIPLLVGLVLLAAATAMLCVGTSKALWIVGRALQGASCSMVWTVGLALLTDTVEEEDLGKYLGIVSLALTGGTLTGPLLGGVVYDHGGYYAVFGMAFALIGVDIILRLLMIEKRTAELWAQEEAKPDQDDHDSNIPASTAPQGPLIPGVIWRDVEPAPEPAPVEPEPLPKQTKQTKRSLIPPIFWLLSSGRLLVALWASLIFAMIATGFDATLPIFVRETFNWSSTGGGLIFLAVFIPSLAGPGVGVLVDRHGPKYYVTGGLLFVTPFYICLRFVTDQSTEHQVLLCILLFMIGLGTSFISTPIYTEIIHIVMDKEKANPGMFGEGGASAQAYGLLNFAIAAGMIFGPMYAGFIKDKFGWGTMGWALALLTGLSSIPVLFFTGGKLTLKKEGALHI